MFLLLRSTHGFHIEIIWISWPFFLNIYFFESTFTHKRCFNCILLLRRRSDLWNDWFCLFIIIDCIIMKFIVIDRAIKYVWTIIHLTMIDIAVISLFNTIHRVFLLNDWIVVLIYLTLIFSWWCKWSHSYFLLSIIVYWRITIQHWLFN